MAQYNTGTVDVTNGSAIVTGVGTEWLANVTAGVDYLVVLGVPGEDIHRLIQTVDSDTQLTLAAPFGGATDTGRTYTILRDFTSAGLPLMDRLDQALQEVHNLAMTRINDLLTAGGISLPVDDTTALVQDPVDNTKLVRIDAGSVATSNTRVLTMADADFDLGSPGNENRRPFQEPIAGNVIVGTQSFDLATMAGEMLRMDATAGAVQLDFPSPGTLGGWDGELCSLRPDADTNLISITVPNPGEFQWQNQFPGQSQLAATLYLGWSQATQRGSIIRVYHRSTSLIIDGPVRTVAGADLLHRENLTVAVGDEVTPLTTGTAKITFRMPYALELLEARASVTTAPTGSTLQCDVNEGGVSIFSTPITIDAGETTSTTAATPPVISDTGLADDAEITIDIDQVGSTIAGTGLKVSLIGYRTG